MSLDEAREVLDEQLENLRDLARWTVAYVAAAVLDDRRAVTNAAYIRGIDIDDLQFDPAAMAERLEAACRETSEAYAWRFAVPCMERFRPAAGGGGGGDGGGGVTGCAVHAGDAHGPSLQWGRRVWDADSSDAIARRPGASRRRNRRDSTDHAPARAGLRRAEQPASRGSRGRCRPSCAAPTT